jgi:hypothetical protein
LSRINDIATGVSVSNNWDTAIGQDVKVQRLIRKSTVGNAATGIDIVAQMF